MNMGMSMYTRTFFPFGVDGGGRRQWVQRGLVERLEGRAARARQLLDGVLVETLQQHPDRGVEFAQREALAVAQRRQDPALDHFHADFDLGFVPRLTRPGRHHGDPVVLGHIAVAEVDVRLVTIRLVHATAQIVRYQDLRCPIEKSKAAHVLTQPIGQLLRPSG